MRINQPVSRRWGRPRVSHLIKPAAAEVGCLVSPSSRAHALQSSSRVRNSTVPGLTKAAFRKVLEEILDVPPGSLRDADTRQTIDGWSSLTDVQILAAIWSELGVDGEPDAFVFETVGELLSLLDAHQAFSA